MVVSLRDQGTSITIYTSVSTSKFFYFISTLRIPDSYNAEKQTPSIHFASCFITCDCPVDNFGTVVGENPTPYGIIALWAVNSLSIVYWV